MQISLPSRVCQGCLAAPLIPATADCRPCEKLKLFLVALLLTATPKQHGLQPMTALGASIGQHSTRAAALKLVEGAVLT